MEKQQRINDAKDMISELQNCLSGLVIDESFSYAVELMVTCIDNGGKVVTTGMGKAGLAMQKFSGILRSFGFASLYIHPGESSHGDLGILSNKDILFVASTSGKTREVLETVELARQINVWKVIGITSHPDSPIREISNVVLDMGIIKEAGYLHLAPTSSIMIMMAITDCLALVCAKEVEITFDDYAKYHHSGYLGQLARSKSSTSVALKEENDEGKSDN